MCCLGLRNARLSVPLVRIYPLYQVLGVLHMYVLSVNLQQFVHGVMDPRLPWQEHTKLASRACLTAIILVCSFFSAADAHTCAQVCTQSQQCMYMDFWVLLCYTSCPLHVVWGNPGLGEGLYTRVTLIWPNHPRSYQAAGCLPIPACAK